MALHPTVEWAQRNDQLFITFLVDDFQNPTINFTDDKITVKGVGGNEKRLFECELEFYKPVESCTAIAKPGRYLSYAVKKKETGPYWPRLIKSDKKCHWIKIDFNRWKEEEELDSDVEANDFGFGDMMNKVQPYEDYEENDEDGNDLDNDYQRVEDNEEEFKATSAVTNPVVNNAEDDQPQLRRRKPKES